LVLTIPSNTTESVNEDQGGSSPVVDLESDGVHHNIWRYNVYNEEGSAIDYSTLACPMWSIDKPKSDDEVVNAFETAAAIEASRVFPYFPEPVLNDGEILSPVWTYSPPYNRGKPNTVNFNAQSDPTFHRTTRVVGVTRKTTIDDICSPTAPWMDPVIFSAERYAMLTTPVFSDVENDGGPAQAIVGHFMAIIPWTAFFSDVIGDSHFPVMVAISNDCGRAFTMLVQKGQDATLLNQADDGKTDRENFNQMKLEMPLASFAQSRTGGRSDCSFRVSIYPTEVMKEAHNTNSPLALALVVLCCFAFTSLAFIAFDCKQQGRQRDLVNIARRQNLLVSALFPQKIQNQLLAEIKENEAQEAKKKQKNKAGRAGLRQFLEREHKNSWGSVDKIENQIANKKAKPIADLFPETTVMFADIVGK
jgi:hypothetical protein